MLSQRLKQVREELGLSQRELARRLNITGAAWQHYETGQNIPGGAVLQGIGALGIDLNWLLMGSGEMRRNQQADGFNARVTPRHSDSKWLEEIGLKELARIASTSNLAVESFVSSVLADRFPHAVSVSELVSLGRNQRIEIDRDELRATLTVFQRRGLAHADEGEVERYRAVSQGSIITARDDTNQAGVTLVAIRRLTEDIFPGVRTGHSKVVSLEATVDARQASSLVTKLRNQVISDCGAVNRDGAGEKLVVVFGAGVVQVNQKSGTRKVRK